MALKHKILLILTATAAVPLILSAALGAVHLSVLSAALVAVASAAVIWWFLSLFLKGVIRPVDNMLNGVRGFLGSDYRLDAVIPSGGWPELERLAGDLNRMMLELQSFRAFQLSRIVEEKNKAQALIDAITDGLVLMDDRGGFIYSNQAALDLLGIPKLSPEAVLPGSIKNEAFVGEFAAILSATERVVKAEVTAVPPSPSEPGGSALRYYRIIASRFFLPTLKRQGCVVILRDVTSEKEREKDKEAFFHMITHDMRSPLATIQGYAEIIMKKIGPSSGTEKFFQSMLHAARHLGGMIDDILNTVKLRSGSLVPVPSDVSANDLITRIIGRQEPVVVARRITIVCETAPEAPRFQGDLALLERVLDNLAGGATRSTPSGGTITFGTGEDAENVVFWVRNTGPALSEETRRTLFDEYPRADKYDGLGLGFAMCKMAVKLHNGRIWVESEAGQGNKFIFTIPKKMV